VKFRVQIDELVLEGFDFHDHKRIAAAMKKELARLIAEKGLDRAGGRSAESASVSAPSFHVPSDRNPRSIGNEIARSVYRGLKQ
jgi:hypothetical protein